MSKYRKFITSSVGFTFLVVGVTGVIFQFFFKNPVLEHIHGWLGVALVVAAGLHILQNSKSLQSHLQDRRVFLLLIPIVAAMAIAILSTKAKSGARGPGLNPREVIGKLFQAQANDLARTFGKDSNAVMENMKKDGLQVENMANTVQEIAQVNHKSPENILPYFVK